jgi:protein-disulfide isomerase
MHDALFGGQESWSGQPSPESVFGEMAGDLGLDQAEFAACLEEGRYTAKVQADYQEGAADGVTGTPAFRINGAELSGAQPFTAFQQQIEYYLAGGEAPTIEVPADSYRSMGQPNAPVVVTEFSDFQCPACAAVTSAVIPDLIEQYVDTGKVRFVYREFPLASIHPVAPQASQAAVCAGQQEMYWEMNAHLFANQDEWSQAADPIVKFKEYAEELGMDTEVFSECLDSGEAALVVQGDIMAGQKLGVNATPYFFVGDLPIRGGLPIEALGQIIDYVAAGGPTPEIVPRGEDFRLLGDVQTARAITVAFVDYASPESADHALKVLPDLMEQYIDTGKLIYVLQPWSPGSDTSSAQAAIAAECAGEQGAYWEMHDQLFEEQDTWTAAAEPQPLFASYAESLNLDVDEIETCMNSEEAALRVQAGNVVAALYGVPGAPIFLFNNGSSQDGSPTLEEFKATLDPIVNP